MSVRKITRGPALAAAAVLSLAVLTSCSDDSSSEASTDSTTAATSTGSATTAATTTVTTAAVTGSSVPQNSGTGSGGDDGPGIAVGEPAPGGGAGGQGEGTGGSDGGTGGGPVDDRCSVEALQQAYGGTVTAVGAVGYCDGDWAVSANSPSYRNQPFMHREHGWVVFDADSSSPGVGHECYTAGYLDQLGAPDAVRSSLVTCYDVGDGEGTETASPQG